MKILMLTWLFWPHVGGVERHVEKVSRSLVSRGHEVMVFTFKHERSLATEDRLGEIGIYRFQRRKPDHWERRRVLGWFLTNRWIIDWADVIHCHDFYTWDWSFLLLRILFFPKPVCLTFHGYEREFPPTSRSIRYRRMAARVTRGNMIIGDYIAKWYGNEYDFVSYGGVDAVEDGGVPREEKAVFKGRLEADTGVLVYLAALRELRERYGVQLPLEIFGDGPLRATVGGLIETSRLEARVHGFVPDVEGRMGSPRFAFASSYLSILEAMIRKRAVFSVYVNELKKDYLFSLPGAGEMMFISASAEDLAYRLYRSLHDVEELNEKVTRAHAFARRQTWERVAEQYLALYEKTGRR